MSGMEIAVSLLISAGIGALCGIIVPTVWDWIERRIK